MEIAIFGSSLSLQFADFFTSVIRERKLLQTVRYSYEKNVQIYIFFGEFECCAVFK